MLIVILAFIGLAILLLWYFLKHDHGRKLPVGSLWIAFGFGILSLIITGIVESFFIPHDLISSADTIALGTKFWTLMGVGVVEEASKFLPLALFIYHRSYFRDHTDGVIYFAICGLTFGLIENISYTLQYGGLFGILRLVMTPFFHAAMAGTLGYYLVNMKINPAARTKFIMACICIPVLHGLYDFGLLSRILPLLLVSLTISILATVSLFLYFSSANRLDRAILATIPISPGNFCTYCGLPNFYRTMFCERCGQHL